MGATIQTNPDGSRSKVTSTSKSGVGGMLRSARIVKGLSQMRLAERANVSLRSIAAWENSETVPSALLAHRVAVALDLDQDARDVLHRAGRDG